MITRTHRITAILLIVALLLMIPFVAMQFTEEVQWSLSDFVVAALLLLGTGFAIELVISKVKNGRYRIALCVAVLLALFLVWAELAVGLFGTPFAGS